MRPLASIFLILFAWTGASVPVLAQDDALEEERQAEAERKEKFRSGFQEIIDDLNKGSLERFQLAIDQENMLERIYGLRLIDQKVKRQFSEDFETSLEGIIKGVFAPMQGNIRAAWLGFGSKGDRAKAIIRYDLPDFQFTYHEYELRLDRHGNVEIVDWIDFLEGEQFSEGFGNYLVSVNPGKPAVRKLIDFQGPSEQQVFQLTELLKAARDRRVDRYFEILEGAHEDIRRQRVVVVMSVQLSKATRQRRKLRTALIDVDKYFPDDPLYSLMLLDYYFPSQKYDLAMQALLRLQDRLRVQDPAMSARLSAAALTMDMREDALAYAEHAVQYEPGLELGWWSALRARSAMRQYGPAIEALEMLEKNFGYTLDQAAFEKDPVMAGLMHSQEFADWFLEHE